MYVVTFYSFKGGTGRTMALVNVAVELVAQGNTVVLVDFDLEAPGLDTFKGFTESRPTKGLVDFVADYSATGVVPDVWNYVYSPTLCEGLPGRLWVMPAGIHDGKYDDRFKSIDWKYLYEKQEGFLLFEDLKEQWRQSLDANYVLIDSRTGHTDVGGICTRQLPDAVAVFFSPNEQNRRGLETIVKGIRQEAEGPLTKEIKTHFVMANVPDLDDEEDILAANVERVRDTLKYDGLSAVIHHYNSLLLLDQNVFILARPKSRLAHEYRQLARAIRRGNMEDREGALDFLEDVAGRLRGRRPSPPPDIEDSFPKILEKHSKDGEILRQMAKIRRRQRKWSEAIALLDQAVALGVIDSDILLTRAELYWLLRNRDAAKADLYRLIGGSEAPAFDLQLAVRLLIELKGDMAVVLESPSIRSLDVSGQLAIARELDSTVDTLPTAEVLMKRVRDGQSDPTGRIRTELMLCLIGQGKFDDAMAQVPGGREGLENLDIYDNFNYAMAEWGKTLTPPKDIFSRVLAQHTRRPGQGANYYQCIAISLWAQGEIARAVELSKEAYERMERNQTESFSCWSYIWVDARHFLRDVNEMERMFCGARILPAFMQRAGISA